MLILAILAILFLGFGIYLIFTSRKCPACGATLEEDYTIPGYSDSLYYYCPNCGHKEPINHSLTT